MESITKADYEELVRLRDAGCVFVFCNAKGNRFGTSDYPMNPESPTLSLRSVIRGVSKDALMFLNAGDIISIKNEINGYERAKGATHAEVH